MGVVTIGVNVGGVSRSKSITRTGTVWSHSETLTPGVAGTLSTRTDDDTGVLTATAHGITQNSYVDVVWVEAGDRNRIRSRMLVTSVATNTLNVDGGSGYNLPVATTSVVVGERYTLTFGCAGDNVNLISLHSAPPSGETTARAVVDFMTSAPATIKVCDLEADEPFVWANNSPIANPLADATVGQVEVSSVSAQAAVLSLEIIYDASP